MSRQPEKQKVPVGTSDLTPQDGLQPSKYAFHQALLNISNMEKESNESSRASSFLKSSSSEETSPGSALESETDAVDPLIKVEQNIANLERALKNMAVQTSIESVAITPETRESKLQKISRRLFKRNLSLGDHPINNQFEQDGKSSKMQDAFSSLKNLIRFGWSKRHSCGDADTGVLDIAAGGFSADEATTKQPPLSADEHAWTEVQLLSDTIKTSPMKMCKVLETQPVALEAADFLICINIIEGHLSSGASVHLLVVMQVGDTKKNTKIKKNTNKPNKDQYSTFVVHVSPAMLENTMIIIKVYIQKNFGKDKLSGTHEISLATVWNHPDHQINNDWLPMYMESKESNPSAYLLCDICVIRKGGQNKIPSINVTEHYDEEANVFAAGGHSTSTHSATMEGMEK